VPKIAKEKNIKKVFGSVVSGLIKDRNIKVAHMAKALDVDRTTIYSWKNGEKLPESDTLMLLAEYFSVTMEHLLTGKKSLDTPPTIIENSDPDCRTGEDDMKELSERVADQRERITDMRSRLDSADSRLTQDVKDLKDRGQQHEDKMVKEFRTHIEWADEEFHKVALEIQKRMNERFSSEIGTIAKACWELHRAQRISDGTLKELENLRCFQKNNNQK